MSVQRLQAEEEVEANLERLKESVSSVEAVLHRTTTPNLKALEKMREVKDKLQGVTQGKVVVTHWLQVSVTQKSRICSNIELITVSNWNNDEVVMLSLPQLLMPAPKQPKNAPRSLSKSKLSASTSSVSALSMCLS